MVTRTGEADGGGRSGFSVDDDDPKRIVGDGWGEEMVESPLQRVGAMFAVVDPHHHHLLLFGGHLESNRLYFVLVVVFSEWTMEDASGRRWPTGNFDSKRKKETEII